MHMHCIPIDAFSINRPSLVTCEHKQLKWTNRCQLGMHGLGILNLYPVDQFVLVKE